MRSAHTRIRLERALSACALALALVTLAVPDWIEEVFGVDPDRGSGALEWAIVAGAAALAVALGLLARYERRRAAP